MASWERAHWEPSPQSGLRRRDQRGGAYRRYVPDNLTQLELAVPTALSRHLAESERMVRALVGSPGASDLDRLSRFLLRSEAIASSMIEGVAPSSRQIALAELAECEPVRSVSEPARLVASNITLIRRATADLVSADAVSGDDILGLHRLLVHERHHGVHEVQNWIGGSGWHPLDAEFVPPDADRVPALLADLVDYLNGGSHAPLVQAALVHAQFETIHPFTDGNGRVGRALIHTVLSRRGLTQAAVLPISIVLATLSERYVHGLTAYRHAATPGSAEANDGIAQWLTVFSDATRTAVDQARVLVAEIAALREDWDERLATWRTTNGLRPSPRADSAAARLLAQLPETPVITSTTVARSLDISPQASRAALDELANADVVTARSIGHGATAYLAEEVLDLVDFAERQLASTRFDTRISPPSRPVPASRHSAPQGSARQRTTP